MTAKTIAALLCGAVLSAVPPPVAADEEAPAPSLAGSVTQRSGYAAAADGIPDAAFRDWYSLTSLDARASYDGDGGSWRVSPYVAYDNASGTWTWSLDEAWGEWRPVAALGLRLGRSPLRYGPCFAFNPANPRAAKDGFDARAGRVGLDGLSIEAHPLLLLGIEDAPVSLVADAALILPSGGTAAYDLEEAGMHARLSFMAPEAGWLGATELGVSCDVSRLGGGARDGVRPTALGAWLSADLAGFVLGAEGSLRSPDHSLLAEPGSVVAPGSGDPDAPEWGWAASANRRLGDWLVMFEGGRSRPDGVPRVFARVARLGDDTEFAVQALVDFETLAARASAEFSWSANDFLVLTAEASWNLKPDEWTPASPVGGTAGVSIECFF